MISIYMFAVDKPYDLGPDAITMNEVANWLKKENLRHGNA
jgi:hypothetical protein